MDGWLKMLVAVTCVAVLAATGWWGWSQWRESVAQEAAAQAEARALHDRQDAECIRNLIAWDAGDREAIVARYGDSAEFIMESCRKDLRRQ